MPAYRSDAEAQIREPAVEALRQLLPGCRVIHEIQCACHGPNRIDVLAVTEDRIAALEVKSQKDKIDRLPAQILSMRRCAHHTIAALHAKFFEVHQHNGATWAVPDWEATRGAVVWGFGFEGATFHPDCPAARRELRDKWDKPLLCPPRGAIDMLWRDELREIVSRLRLRTSTSRLNMDELRDAITWNLTGAEVTREVCAALRERKCPEADPEIPRIEMEPQHG